VTPARVETDPQAMLRRMSADDFDPLAEVLVEEEVTWKPLPAVDETFTRTLARRDPIASASAPAW
jgi:hypothetical protein